MWSRTSSAYVQTRTLLKQSTLLLTCVKNGKLSLLSLHTRTHTDRISCIAAAHTWPSGSPKLYSHILNLPPAIISHAAAVVAAAALPRCTPCSFSAAATPTFTRRLPLGTSVALCLSLLHIYVRLSAQRVASASVNVFVCRRMEHFWTNCLAGMFAITLHCACVSFIYLLIRFYSILGPCSERLSLKAVGCNSFFRSGPFTWRTNQLPREPSAADRRPLPHKMLRNCCWTPLAEWIPNIWQFITATLHHVIGPPLQEINLLLFRSIKAALLEIIIFQICSFPFSSATLFWFSD